MPLIKSLHADKVIAGQGRPKVEFWFDAVCPWCWITSRWAAEVAETRGFDIEWHPFSLRILNEGKPTSSCAKTHDRGFRHARVIEAARRERGNSAAGDLYTEFGTRTRLGGRDDTEAIIAEGLAAAGLPAEFSTYAVSGEADDTEASLRANMARALELAGSDVGIPIVAIDGNAFVGPALTPAPAGDDALKLWDALVAVSSIPGFYELKLGRTIGPQF